MSKPQGFAVIDPQRRREIASQGGRARAAAGTGHIWTSEEAREAGRKGGLSTARKRCKLQEFPYDLEVKVAGLVTEG